jgi:hypothetical protein
MTVGELIEKLRQFPADAPVVCYDGGHDPSLGDPQPELVLGKAWSLGREPAYQGEGRVPGVIL